MALWILLYHLNINELVYSGKKLWLTMILLNRDISGFRLCIYGFFITTYHHSSATFKSLLEWQWSVHSIATPSLPLHCHSAMALQCSFAYLRRTPNTTPVAHSVATPMPLPKYTPECTPHCHSVTTTPMPLSKYTPMPLRSVFGVLISIFATHSYATPIPLHKVGVAL